MSQDEYKGNEAVADSATLTQQAQEARGQLSGRSFDQRAEQLTGASERPVRQKIWLSPVVFGLIGTMLAVLTLAVFFWSMTVNTREERRLREAVTSLNPQRNLDAVVTSTMKDNPPADLPPSPSAVPIEVAKFINVVVKPAEVSGEPPQIEINKEAVNLAELKLKLQEQARAQADGIHVMLLIDRTMKNSDLNEVEVLLSEIPGVKYHFGVQDRRE